MMRFALCLWQESMHIFLHVCLHQDVHSHLAGRLLIPIQHLGNFLGTTTSSLSDPRNGEAECFLHLT